jgi:hypothetical protein
MRGASGSSSTRRTLGLEGLFCTVSAATQEAEDRANPSMLIDGRPFRLDALCALMPRVHDLEEVIALGRGAVSPQPPTTNQSS